MIAESRDRLVLERGLLIDRQSGTLVFAWQSDTSSQRNEESTLVSSMFAAISTFTAENYDGPDAELRTLDLNGRQVALRHSARHMLVVEHTGAMHADAAHHIDECFETIIENTEEHAALADVDLLSLPQAEQYPAVGQSNSAKYFFAALAFVMLGLLAWHIWDRVWFSGNVEMVTQTVGEQAPFHAPSIENARLERTITVRGLVPPDFTLNAVRAQLAQAGITLNNLTQPVAGATDLSNTRTEITEQLSTLAQGISELEESLQRQNQNISVGFNASLDAIAEQLRDQSSDLQVEQAALGERIEGILSALTTMRSQLSDQAEVLAAQGDLADQQASSIENLNTAIARQRDALASLDKRMVEGASNSAEVFARMSADLQTQQSAIEESQRGLDLAKQQLADLSAAQARSAAGFLEALRLRFADESLPEDPALMASQIQQMAELATTHRFGLLIQGYSDQTGSDEINQRISLQRANYIRNQLIEAGLPEEILNAEGLGAVADVNGVVARQVRVRVLERDR
ncbi:MAG: OmpA family protein [Ahrensia sp.]